MATIGAGWTQVVLDYAVSRGMGRAQLINRLGAEEALLASPDFRVGQQENLRLWKYVEKQLADELRGLAMARGLQTQVMGVLGFAAQASATLGEAMRLCVDFYPLVRDWGRAELVVQGPHVVMRTFGSLHGDQWTRSLAEFTLGAQVALGQQWLGRPLPLEAVHFKHPQPSDTYLYEQVFQCPVRFEQPYNELLFSREALVMPLARSEPGLRGYLLSHARVRMGELGELTPRNTVVREVREALAEALSRVEEGGPSIGQVAQRLFISARSLQRHLKRGGYTFQELLDEARHRRAQQLLQQPGMTLRQVSDALGFSEPTALRRALRRWVQRERAQRGTVAP